MGLRPAKNFFHSLSPARSAGQFCKKPIALGTICGIFNANAPGTAYKASGEVIGIRTPLFLSEAAARTQARIDAIPDMLPDVYEVFGQAMTEGTSKLR